MLEQLSRKAFKDESEDDDDARSLNHRHSENEESETTEEDEEDEESEESEASEESEEEKHSPDLKDEHPARDEAEEALAATHILVRKFRAGVLKKEEPEIKTEDSSRRALKEEEKATSKNSQQPARPLEYLEGPKMPAAHRTEA